jgi:hypothetical protein
MANPKVQEVISNTPAGSTPLNKTVMELDFKDLSKYLETGVSEKFGQEKLLGHWGYDENATLQLNKKLKPDVGAAVWFRMKNELTDRFDNAVFTAFYDKKAKLSLAANKDGKASPLRAIPPPATAPRGTPTNYVALWANTNALYSSAGKWSENGPNYFVTLGNPKNGTATSEAKLERDRLTFQFGGGALAFRKLPD